VFRSCRRTAAKHGLHGSAHNFQLIAHTFNISYILASFQAGKCGPQGGDGS